MADILDSASIVDYYDASRITFFSLVKFALALHVKLATEES